MTLTLLDRHDLVTLIDDVADGVVLLTDPGLQPTFVNRAGRGILAHAGDPGGGSDLEGRAHLLATRDRRTAVAEDAPSVEVVLGARVLVTNWRPLASVPGHVALLFRDVTDLRFHEDRLQAFSRTSASLAFAETLTEGLDALAHDVRQTTDMDSCTFLLMEPDGDLRQVGISGDYPMTSDYGDRIRACRELGAPLLAYRAVAERRPFIVSGWRERTLEDPRFAPLHEVGRAAGWDTIAVIPLIVRGEIVGVFNGFYLPDGGPSASEIAFLSAVADQAAVAVDNARLLVELERRATLDERHRLARELHDSVSQALFSLTLQARAVEVLCQEEQPALDAVRVGLADVRDLTRGVLAEMRALIFQLRPEALHEEGLVNAIRRHSAAIAAREGINVQVNGLESLHGLGEHEERELFRVVVEAITNAVKHASPSSIVTTFDQDDERLIITVADDGPGFEPTLPRPGHLGLTSMSERVEGIGGTLHIRSGEAGTTVEVHVPTGTAGPGEEKP